MIVLSGLDDETLWALIKSYKLKYLIIHIDTINTIKPCFGLHDSTLYQDRNINSFETKNDNFEQELIGAGSQHARYPKSYISQ